jgi:hypothetical protein
LKSAVANFQKKIEFFVVFNYVTGLFIVLTLPALYERYEDYIDKFVLSCYKELCQLYRKINEKYISRVQYWILEKKKLS